MAPWGSRNTGLSARNVSGGFSESTLDGLSRLPPKPRHSRLDFCIREYGQPKCVLAHWAMTLTINKIQSLFCLDYLVIHSTLYCQILLHYLVPHISIYELCMRRITGRVSRTIDFNSKQQPLWFSCYIIVEGFFLILSFFVGYILSFGLVWLRNFRLCARVGAHIERRCSRSRREDVTITDIIIKTPDRKCDWGCEWRHARKRLAGILGYLEKSNLLRFGPRRVHLFAAGCTRVGWVSVLRADAGQTVSIVRIVSRSPHIENLKVKKEIKVSYLN